MRCEKCSATLPTEARFCLQCGERVEAPAAPPSDRLREALERAVGDQYRIERLLGRGGMGAVYLAHERALDRDVAIKVLPPDRAGASDLRERFQREARTVARLTHPNIVPLHTFAEADGLVYFVMSYVAGESLASRLQREGPLSSGEARVLFTELAEALDYAHQHDVIHRDIKPDNILLDAESGSARLTDFGIAKGPAEDSATVTGHFLGTPAYMSPEQMLGRRDIDARADLYSLGAVFYEVLSGRRPFESRKSLAEAERLPLEPVSLRSVAPHADDDLVVAINRCLQPDPAKRWPDARSLRFHLAAADDQIDDPLAVRFLRLFSWGACATTLVMVYAFVFARVDPSLRSIRVLATLSTGAAIGCYLGALGVALWLRRHGPDVRTIVRTAFRQPRGWRFWYPRTLRRRGDVWDRLPLPVQRVRRHFAILAGFVFTVFLPLCVGLLLLRRMVGVLGLELLVVFAGALVFVERHRVTKQIASRLGASMAEASKIISTPTWRTDAWRRGPAASLIRPETPENDEAIRARAPVAATTLSAASEPEPADRRADRQ